MEKNKSLLNPDKFRLLRCADWLQKQNNEESKKSLQNKNLNDIQFILETNAARRKFFVEAADNNATVPDGVDEPHVEPKDVPLRKLRVEQLHLECEWQACKWTVSNYDDYQRHVRRHISQLHVIDCNGTAQYVCLWDVCGHKTTDFNEMVRHVNFHAYHGKLLAIGFNGRATLKLDCCKKDSTKRNLLPPLLSDHCCLWTGCDYKFNSVQMLFDHIRTHVNNAERLLCSWAGCGAQFSRRVFLVVHVRSHTQEKLIACYHCGQRFTCNRKLADHLRRQNAHPDSGFTCNVCGLACATDYLLRSHVRAHVSVYACTQCDMSAPTLSCLASHVRYRHLASEPGVRTHKCHLCEYKAVTKWDLRKHVVRHVNRDKLAQKKLKRLNDGTSSDSEDLSDNENLAVAAKKKKAIKKKYICHMCESDGITKIFTFGTKLTSHLVKLHGVQWPFGHSRFRYQISDDGMYRLTTTRYESLEVSKEIVDGSSGPKGPITNSFKFEVIKKAEATETKPNQFVIEFKDEQKSDEPAAVEITMCDVDEQGNIIKSDVYYNT